MSGETDYVEDKLGKFEKRIDDIELKVGLNHIVHNPEAERLLSLSEIELDKMTADECAQAKYTVLQYALTIQKNINRAMAIKNWCERNINVIIAKEFGSLNEFMKMDIKRQTIININTYANRLAEISEGQQIVIDSLSYIAQASNSIAGAFQTLFMSKGKIEHNEHY